MKTNQPAKVKVIQNPEDQIPVAVLAEAITSISKGIKALRSGPLTERAIIILIEEASPGIGPKCNRKSVGRPQIKAVLDGMSDLERQFVRKHDPHHREGSEGVVGEQGQHY